MTNTTTSSRRPVQRPVKLVEHPSFRGRTHRALAPRARVALPFVSLNALPQPAAAHGVMVPGAPERLRALAAA